ncbi:MAG: DUF5996 family protein [Actinomycetota bacterium]
MTTSPLPSPWSPLPTDEWTETLETLHLWTQVVGKIRLVQSPWLNHSWSVVLYPTPSGLRSSLVPHEQGGFEITFDVLAERLTLETTDGARRELALETRTVADFYGDLMGMLASVGMPVEISTTPNELAEVIPFPEDTTHSTFEPDHARALQRALIDGTRVMQRYRAGFRGKASPVHFFWGSFDLATTRFSGREAPAHPGGVPNFADDVAQEAYSHEVTSVGFWPGNAEAPAPIFYAYAYPTPDGFSDAAVQPSDAFWLDALGEFALPHAALVGADDPDAALLSFFETTHAAAADLASWDRNGLECAHPDGPDWWVNRPHG